MQFESILNWKDGQSEFNIFCVFLFMYIYIDFTYNINIQNTVLLPVFIISVHTCKMDKFCGSEFWVNKRKFQLKGNIAKKNQWGR